MSEPRLPFAFLDRTGANAPWLTGLTLLSVACALVAVALSGSELRRRTALRLVGATLLLAPAMGATSMFVAMRARKELSGVLLAKSASLDWIALQDLALDSLRTAQAPLSAAAILCWVPIVVGAAAFLLVRARRTEPWRPLATLELRGVVVCGGLALMTAPVLGTSDDGVSEREVHGTLRELFAQEIALGLPKPMTESSCLRLESAVVVMGKASVAQEFPTAKAAATECIERRLDGVAPRREVPRGYRSAGHTKELRLAQLTVIYRSSLIVDAIQDDKVKALLDQAKTDNSVQ
jgi:hypothetical protein